MNAPVNDSLAWSPRKLLIAVAIALLAQLALIFTFSSRGDFHPRKADAKPAVKLFNGAGSEWLRVSDPTLFARAHPDGVSARAWLNIPPHEYQIPDRPAPAAWLALAPESLGSAFGEFMKSYSPEGITIRSWQPPTVTAPTRLRYPPLPESRVQLLGPIAERGILSTPPLPSWASSDILGPTRVQVLVDVWGNPMSAALLQSCGLQQADDAAVELARKFVFGPARSEELDPKRAPEVQTATGWLIFTWRTTPAATNAGPNPR